MEDRPRLHWCPTGPFVFIPLHAAGAHDSPHPVACMDYVVSSYTPTISALARARQHPIRLCRNELSLLLLSAPIVPDLPPLPYVEKEIREVETLLQSIAGAHFTDLTDTSVEDAIIALPTADILHLACHGTQNMRAPLDSAFHLSQGQLRINHLLDAHADNPTGAIRKAEIAFLSACETAQGAIDRPDESVHLAAAMLFAGFKSVIATLWYVIL
jgi:CHAT domain-containing protein